CRRCGTGSHTAYGMTPCLDFVVAKWPNGTFFTQHQVGLDDLFNIANCPNYVLLWLIRLLRPAVLPRRLGRGGRRARWRLGRGHAAETGDGRKGRAATTTSAKPACTSVGAVGAARAEPGRVARGKEGQGQCPRSGLAGPGENAGSQARRQRQYHQ